MLRKILSQSSSRIIMLGLNVFSMLLLSACGNVTSLSTNEAHTPLSEIAPTLSGIPSPRPNVTLVSSQGSMAPPSLGIVIDGSGKIVHIEPSKPAANAGIKIGDVLISVGPIKVLEDPQGVRNYLAVLGYEQSVSIVYSSDGNARHLEVPLPSLEPIRGTESPIYEATELPTLTPINQAYPDPPVKATDSTVASVNQVYPEPPVRATELIIATPTTERAPEHSTPVPEYPKMRPTGVYPPFQYF